MLLAPSFLLHDGKQINRLCTSIAGAKERARHLGREKWDYCHTSLKEKGSQKEFAGWLQWNVSISSISEPDYAGFFFTG